MTRSHFRGLRIIPAEPVSSGDAGITRDTFDYAALLNQPPVHRLAGPVGRPPPSAEGARRTLRQSVADGGETQQAQAGHPCAGPAPSERGRRRPAWPAPWLLDTVTESGKGRPESHLGFTTDPALAHRLGESSLAVLGTVAQQQGIHVMLQALADEIASFCLTPAVQEAGYWQVNMQLDTPGLTDTHMHLSLDSHTLHLEFNSPSVSSRTLLLDHSAALCEQLRWIFGTWDDAREISLAVL